MEDGRSQTGQVYSSLEKHGKADIYNCGACGYNSCEQMAVAIYNVADQTKIIAFNAELEASSSGEAGKNFHIVATEIRRLSDMILDSIKEIKNGIDEIQAASDRLVLDSEKGTRQINVSWENAKTLEKGFGSIMASSQSVADDTMKIKNSVGQVAASSGKLSESLLQIAQGIERFSS